MTDPGAPLQREWRAPFPIDIPMVLSVHRRGAGDPAYRAGPGGAIWRTVRTPDGPATLRLTGRRDPDGQATTASGVPAAAGAGGCTLVTALTWGPGADWLADSVPAMLGGQDEPGAFQPEHQLLRDLARRHPGARIGRSTRVFEALVPAVLEQKVVGMEATRAWRLLLRWYGEAAPGPAPAGMLVTPPPEIWASIPSWDWHRAGVEAVRARTIAAAATVAPRLEEIIVLAAAEADRRLRSLPGIGPWTSAEVRQRACGDPDAVSVGDYHLPRIVGWALTGQITDDAGMLDLLAPFAGHRHRVAVLLAAGGLGPPRRGRRNTIRDYRAF